MKKYLFLLSLFASFAANAVPFKVDQLQVNSISASAPITSTVVTGTAPFAVSSTTAVANLTATNLSGGTVAATTISATVANPSLNYQSTSSGSVARSYESKFGDTVSVFDFGADPTGAVDSSAAFQNAVNALPSTGGRIVVGNGTFLINTAPTWGSKSIYWDISPSAYFTGTGTGANGSFPRAASNISMLPLGPFIQSQSTAVSTPGNSTAAFVAESIQPAGVNGGTVGVYGAATSSNNLSNSDIWGANFLVSANAGAGRGVWGAEIDVNANSSATGVRYYGVDVTGIGSVNPDVGVIVERADSSIWQVGERLTNSSLALDIPASSVLTSGIAIGSPSAITNTLITSKQLINNGDNIVLQRFTDTSPTGYFLRGVNSTNSTNLFLIDVNGNAAVQNMVAMDGLTVSGGLTQNTTANSDTEYGSTTAANTPYYDWHSSGNNIDYDSRIIASGGSATVGTGTLDFIDALTQFTSIQASVTIQPGIYTVSTLPAAGTKGREAVVTDATAPTYLGTLTGGGTVVTPVMDNGSAWVSY